MVSQRTINRIARKFRVLHDWKVEPAEDVGDRGPYNNGRCTQDVNLKHGSIFPCPRFLLQDDGTRTPIYMVEYVFHEILHIAFGACRGNHKWHEMLVQDICRIVYPDDTGHH